MNKNFIQFMVSMLLIVSQLSACSGDDEDTNLPPLPEQGFVSGNVIDAVTKSALPNVSIIVTDENNNPVTTATTDSAGHFYIALYGGSQYDFSFSLSGHYPSHYVGIQVRNNEETVLEAILQIDDSISGVGSISGQITDALTGNALSAALLSFRSGINATNGSVLAETSTDLTGSYTLLDTLQTGHYTCEINLSGYVINYFTVLVLGGQLTGNQNASISPTLPPGETRIVLSWGASPWDLDSHITGPISDNSSQRFHVYFANPGRAASQPFTLLDVDDTSSFGPETITIKSQFQGLYRYSVHDFTNRGLLTSTGLATSGAKVTVYRGTDSPRVFNVPSGIGTLWTVFELDGAIINPVNTLSNEVNSFAAQSLTTFGIDELETVNDAALISNVPYK